MGPAMGDVIEITSDDEKEAPLADKPTADALDWASSLLLDDLTGFGEGLDDSAVIQELLSTLEGEKKGDAAAGDDDDDCVILDGDPDKPLVVVKEEKPGKEGSDEDLQVVLEKGEVACRDFPHARHLCARLPFRTGSHANHCTMCHCYVCDCRAPCPKWGKGTLSTDHCHATDKDEKWKEQRQALKRKSPPSSKRDGVKKMSLSSSTTSPCQQYTGHQVSVAQPYTPLGTTVNQPLAARVPVASNVSKNQHIHPSALGTVNQPFAGRFPVASNVNKNQQMHPSALGTRVNQPSAARVPVANNVSKNQQIHPSALGTSVNQPFTGRVPVPSNVNKYQQMHPSALGTSVNQPSAARVPVANNVSENQHMHPSALGTSVNQPLAGRVPVPSNVSKNQAMYPSAMAPHYAVHLPKAPAPSAKISGKRSKGPGAAPKVYTPSNGYIVNPALLNNAPLHPASLRALQAVQAAAGSRGLPGSNIIQGFSARRSLAAPVQVRPMPHIQAAPNGAVGTSGLQLSQCSSRITQTTQQVTQATQQVNQATQRVTQATQCAQDASAIQNSWQVALANLASDLGVSDYNIDPPQVQQPVSTQPLHHTQPFAQPKAVQGGETHLSNTPATAHMRPSNGLPQPDHESGDSAVSVQKTQALCVLNSQGSLTSSETFLK